MGRYAEDEDASRTVKAMLAAESGAEFRLRAEVAAGTFSGEDLADLVRGVRARPEIAKELVSMVADTDILDSAWAEPVFHVDYYLAKSADPSIDDRTYVHFATLERFAYSMLDDCEVAALKAVVGRLEREYGRLPSVENFKRARLARKAAQ